MTKQIMFYKSGTMNAVNKIALCRTTDDEYCFKDSNCLQTIIHSFSVSSNSNVDPNPRSLLNQKLAFFFSDLDSIELYEHQTHDEALELADKKNHLITKLVIKAILTELHKSGCTQKKTFGFQSREGSLTSNNFAISGIDIINIDGGKDDSIVICPSKETDTISHTYAYIGEKQCCIFLNPRITTEQKKHMAKVIESLDIIQVKTSNQSLNNPIASTTSQNPQSFFATCETTVSSLIDTLSNNCTII